MAAIILEDDMRPGEYYGVIDEKGEHFKAGEHCKDKETSPALRILLDHTLLRSEVGTMEGLVFIRRQVQKIKFRKYKKFKPNWE